MYPKTSQAEHFRPKSCRHPSPPRVSLYPVSPPCSGINHNIDELLVGITTQLKLRTRARSEQKQNKASGRILEYVNPHSLFFNYRFWTFLVECSTFSLTRISPAVISISSEYTSIHLICTNKVGQIYPPIFKCCSIENVI